MTYFADLTPYEYLRTQQPMEVVNVGWLNFHEDFTKGEAPEGLVERLEGLPLTRLCRGFHICPWCQVEHTGGPDESPYGNPDIAKGNGEIWVAGDRKIYAAPAMLPHYIKEHKYLPPEEFIDVVMYMKMPS